MFDFNEFFFTTIERFAPKITDSEQEILDLIKNEPKITREKLAQKKGLAPKNTCQKGFLKRYGGRIGYWKVLQ